MNMMKLRTMLIGLPLVLAACPSWEGDFDGDGELPVSMGGQDCEPSDPDVTMRTWWPDADEDGYGDEGVDGHEACDPPVEDVVWVERAGDCDDLDPGVHPEAPEVCDHVDNNCVDGVDEGLAVQWWADADGDGYGDVTDSAWQCDVSEGYVSNADDCDDADDRAHPGAAEVCDGIDNDCDGDVDDGLPTYPWYADADGDTYGDPTTTLDQCPHPDGYTSNDEDCDDTNADVHPEAEDAWYDGVDADCAGDSDYDADGDGFDSDVYGGDDCDDGDPSVSPLADEVYYDGVDADCDGQSDWDADHDGHDTEAHPGGDDCDDTTAAISPSATETWYNGVDEDCDGRSDYDRDGDGEDASSYGGGDCNDSDATVHTGAAEVWYDGVDQDCDGGSDYDQDGDGFVSDTYGGSDCADTDAAVSPAATEVWYDGVDQDCDGGSDFDQDGDGYDYQGYGGTDCDDTRSEFYPGAPDTVGDGYDQSCDGTDGMDADGDQFASVASGGSDCDDLDPSTFLGALEIWYNGDDNDCDGGSDYDQDGDGHDSDQYDQDGDGDMDGDDCLDTDAATYPGSAEHEPSLCVSDADGDGWGDLHPPTTLFDVGEDCDDADATTFPGAAELESATACRTDADGDGYGSLVAPIDGTAGTDCDDTHDRTFPGAAAHEPTLCARDGDGDGYGDASPATAGVDAGEDCDDTVASIRPDGTDGYGNGVDENCDGIDGIDDDRDGFAAAPGPDCDDELASTYPGAPDTWYDGTDADCAGNSDYDADGDGYDSEAVLGVDGDCDDTLDTVHPGNAWDWGDASHIDDDCDGLDDAQDLVASAVSAISVTAGHRIVVGNAGDYDGDGVLELVFGEPEASWAGFEHPPSMVVGGRVWITSGPPPATVLLSTATALTARGSEGSRYGDAVGFVGDVDGDGDDELLVGAPELSQGELAHCGAVYLKHSAPGSSGTTTLTLLGEEVSYHRGEHLGLEVARAGDTDGDGLADYLVRSNEAVYLIEDSTLAGTELVTDAADCAWPGATAMAGGGDFDGDGYDDVVLGWPDVGDGVVDVWYGSSASCSTVRVFTGGYAGEDAGASVAFVGDVDGDGQDDFVLGAPEHDAGVGTAYLVRSGSGTVFISGLPTDSIEVGAVVAGGQDLTGDGVPEVVVGVPGWSPSSTEKGAALVFRSGTRLENPAALLGAANFDRTGSQLAVVPDLTGGTGLGALLVGHGTNSTSTHYQTCYLIPGSP